MSNYRGGYQIIDMKKVSLTTTAQDVDSTLRDKIVNSGKPCVLTNLVIHGVTLSPTYTTFTVVDSNSNTYSDFIYVDGYGLRRIVCNTLGKFSVVVMPYLPFVSSSDNGKALVVSSGVWSAQTIATLPTVTAADNGKVLMVKNGAWSVESLPE